MGTLTLKDLPELPAGSAVEIEDTFDGVELRWRNPRSGDREAFLLGLFLLVPWVVVGVILGSMVARELAGGAPSEDGLKSIVFWGALVVVAAAIVPLLHLVITLAARRREVLLLGRTELRHRAGTPPFYGTQLRDWLHKEWKEGLQEYFRRPWYRAFIDPDLWRPLRPRKRATLQRDAVSGVSLQLEGNRQRLIVEVGGERLEIAPYLRGLDREWLADVLQLWLERS